VQKYESLATQAAVEVQLSRREYDSSLQGLREELDKEREHSTRRVSGLKADLETCKKDLARCMAEYEEMKRELIGERTRRELMAASGMPPPVLGMRSYGFTGPPPPIRSVSRSPPRGLLLHQGF
jgi:hypothetical protein